MFLNFTLIFKDNSGNQIAYRIAYEPIPILLFGNDVIASSNGVHYEKGLVKKLMEHNFKMNYKLLDKCIIVADEKWKDNDGFDTVDTIERIVADIELEGYSTKVNYI